MARSFASVARSTIIKALRRALAIRNKPPKSIVPGKLAAQL